MPLKTTLNRILVLTALTGGLLAGTAVPTHAAETKTSTTTQGTTDLRSDADVVVDNAHILKDNEQTALAEYIKQQHQNKPELTITAVTVSNKDLKINQDTDFKTANTAFKTYLKDHVIGTTQQSADHSKLKDHQVLIAVFPQASKKAQTTVFSHSINDAAKHQIINTMAADRNQKKNWNQTLTDAVKKTTSLKSAKKTDQKTEYREHRSSIWGMAAVGLIIATMIGLVLLIDFRRKKASPIDHDDHDDQ